MLHVADDGGELLADGELRDRGRDMVQHNIDAIREELIDLKKKGLALHTEDVREELVKAQLEGYEPHVAALTKDDKYLTIPVEDFKNQVMWLLAEAKKLDPSGRSVAAGAWQRSMQNMVLRRKDADDNKGIVDDPFDLSLSRIAQKDGYAEYEAAVAAAMDLPSERRSAFQRRMVQVQQALDVLDRAGVEFVFIPGGTYKLGAPEGEALTVHPDPRAHGTPPEEKRLAPFFISKHLVQTKQLLTLAKEAVQLPELEALTRDLSLRQSNHTPVAGEDADAINPWTGDFGSDDGGGWVQRFVHTEKDRDDGAAEMTYFRAKQLASATGASIPHWAQWEAAARGLEGHRYPWGDHLVDQRLYVVDAGADCDDGMQFAAAMGSPVSVPAVSPRTSPSAAPRPASAGRDIRKLRKILGFGEYGPAASVFGLGGAVRAGCEWNAIEPNEFQPLRTRVYSTTHEDPPTTHILRSLSAFSYLQPPSAQSHQHYTGPCLAAYGKPGEVRRAAFRLVFSLNVDPVTPCVRKPLDDLLSLLGKNEFACLQCLGRIEDLERDGADTHAYYYSKGVRVDAVDGAITSVVLFSGPDETRDYATCEYLLSSDGELTMASLESAAQLPPTVTSAHHVDVWLAAADDGDVKTRRTTVLRVSAKQVL